MDKDNVGYIPVEKVAEVLRGNPDISPQQIEEIENAIDVDGDGKVTFDEFSIYWKKNIASPVHTISSLQATADPRDI